MVVCDGVSFELQTLMHRLSLGHAAGALQSHNRMSKVGWVTTSSWRGRIACPIGGLRQLAVNQTVVVARPVYTVLPLLLQLRSTPCRTPLSVFVLFLVVVGLVLRQPKRLGTIDELDEGHEAARLLLDR